MIEMNMTARFLPTGLNQDPSSGMKFEANNNDNTPVIIFTRNI